MSSAMLPIPSNRRALRTTAALVLTVAAMSSEAAPAAPSPGVSGQAVITAVVGTEVGIALDLEGRPVAVGSLPVAVTREELAGVVVTTVVPQ